ncbi:MAG TPA: phage protein Gp36 family protein [bacterium]|nr:phage protein Gp36 family protein [bacterium]
MNTLPRYMKGSRARFDFRVPDGLGHWVFPDWDDPDLKVEFRDSDGTLRATAVVGGELPLSQGNDYDESANPDGGPFVAVEGIDLTSFALGTAEAWVYARAGGAAVQPYPSILAAFEVVAGAAQGPLYTSVDRVRLDGPGTWPESVTDEMITMAIADASRKMDAFLRTCYATPFPDIGDEPATPEILESICRKLALNQCMLWMGRVNATAEEVDNIRQDAMSELMYLVPALGRSPIIRLPGYTGPVSVYRGELGRSDDA